MIQEENISWSGMVEDFNIVDKFKTEIVDNLNEIENMWTSRNPDYKPFKLPTTEDSPIKELNSIKDLNIQEEKQIGDQYPFIYLFSFPVVQLYIIVLYVAM